jgi:hypothetical protein
MNLCEQIISIPTNVVTGNGACNWDSGYKDANTCPVSVSVTTPTTCQYSWQSNCTKTTTTTTTWSNPISTYRLDVSTK